MDEALTVLMRKICLAGEDGIVTVEEYGELRLRWVSRQDMEGLLPH
jgi:hypothetical protein